MAAGQTPLRRRPQAKRDRIMTAPQDTLFDLLPDDEAKPAVFNSFVDEAGDSTLFNRRGAPLIGTNGCSRFFMMGKLDVENPKELGAKLTALRQTLLADPYFAGVPSFNPARKKTAHQFHAKDDIPEVRYEVFKLLAAAGKNLRFRAVVCDKAVILAEEKAKRENTPGYRYNQDSLYDHLVCKLFAGWHASADDYKLVIAKRGAKDRNGAIVKALRLAEEEFVKHFRVTRDIHWNVTVSDPASTVCLQAADYFLWALQRFYEERENPKTGEMLREDRYLNMLWPQFATVQDLHFGDSKSGTTFIPSNPLTLETRFTAAKKGKKKMS